MRQHDIFRAMCFLLKYDIKHCDPVLIDCLYLLAIMSMHYLRCLTLSSLFILVVQKVQNIFYSSKLITACEPTKYMEMIDTQSDRPWRSSCFGQYRRVRVIEVRLYIEHFFFVNGIKQMLAKYDIFIHPVKKNLFRSSPNFFLSRIKKNQKTGRMCIYVMNTDSHQCAYM